MNPPNAIASDTLVEAIAVAILNSDRIAGGWPPVESRDDIPDSDGYVRNAAAALTAITEAGYAVVPVSEGNPKCEADCARHWTGVRNKNADLRRTVAALEDEIVEAVEHLEAVLFSDPGPKMLASIGAARAWWLKRDAISAAQGDGE